MELTNWCPVNRSAMHVVVGSGNSTVAVLGEAAGAGSSTSEYVYVARNPATSSGVGPAPCDDDDAEEGTGGTD